MTKNKPIKIIANFLEPLLVPTNRIFGKERIILKMDFGSKTIKFVARTKTGSLIQTRPTPASQFIPGWWKEMTPYHKSLENPDGKKLLVRERMSNATFKRCTPMLDSLTSGYMFTLWADVQVTQLDGFPYITWRTQHEVFQQHSPSSREIPAPLGYDQIVFKYLNTWIPKTPKGYSCYFTSPHGYQNLPFKAISAIVDTDKSKLDSVFPMWVQSGFEGIVEAGTPMVQMIPFKRDDWKAEFDSYEDGEYESVISDQHFNKHIVSHYKQNVWSKKSFK